MTRIELQSPHYVWLAMLGLAAVLTAVVWLYRPQVRPLPAPWWWMLLGLRMVGIGVLAVMIVRPAIRRPAGQSERGIIAVLVDQSKSMSAVDTARTPADWVQVAAALGALPPDARSPALGNLRAKGNELLRQIDEITRAKSELQYARLSGRGVEQADAHLHDAQNALLTNARAMADSPAAKTLKEQLLQISPDTAAEPVIQINEQLDLMQADEDERLYQSNDAVRAACDELSHQPRIELVRRALARLSFDRPMQAFGYSQTLSPLQTNAPALKADGSHSDISVALRQLRQKLSAQRVAAVVLFADGHEVGADPSVVSAWTDAPIIVVSTAAASLKDVSITNVTLPDSAFVGETINVGVDLRATGYDAASIPVTLQSGLQQQTKLVPINSQSGHVELPLTLDKPGLRTFTITATPQTGEATTENNSVQRIIKAISEKIHVAVFSEGSTQDEKFLHDSFAQLPGLDVAVQPLNAGQIAKQDVFIIDGITADSLDGTQWDAIKRAVDEQAASVIFVPSDPIVASKFADDPHTAWLLPWHGDAPLAWRSWPGDNPNFHVMPVKGSFPDKLKSFDDAAGWLRLPAINRFLSMPPLNKGVQTFLIERESGLPVLTEMKIGSGRVMMLGIDETWRWGQSVGRNDQQRFWSQLIRYAGKEPFVLSDGLISLDADPISPQPDEALHVRVKLSGQLKNDSPETLELTKDSQVVHSEQLPIKPSEDQNVEKVLSGVSAGDYQLQLIAGKQSLCLPIHVAENDEAEMRDVSGDPTELRRLAGSRGDVLGWNDLPSLSQRIEQLRQSDPQFTELRLWDSPYLFLFVLSCLGVEWAVRRRFGLA